MKKRLFLFFALQLFLVSITLILWYNKISFYFGLSFYLIIMIYLLITKKPIYWSFFVIFYSVFHYYDKSLVKSNHILSGILVIYSLTKLIINKEKFKFGKIGPILVIIMAYILSSISWAPDPLFSLGGFGVIFQGYVMYFVLINSRDENIDFKEISIFASSLLFVTLYIFTVHVAINNVFDEVIKDVIKGHAGIYGSLFANINFVAAILGFLVPLSLSKYVLFKTKYKFLFIPLDILFVLSIFLTASRGLYFGFIVLVLTLIMLALKFGKKRLAFSYLLGALLFMAFIIYVIVNKDIKPEFYQKINKFSSSRIKIYEQGLKVFLSSPFNFIFGGGVRSSYYYINEGALFTFENYAVSTIYYHNFIIQILGTLGIVGACLYSILFYKIFEIVSNKDIYSKIILLSLVMFLAHQLQDISFENQFIGMMYYGLIAILELKQDQIKTFNDSELITN